MNKIGMDVKNKVFLITGGTSGVGKAIASGLAKLGAKIVIVSRSQERGQNALKDIAEATGNDKGEALVADLSLQSSIREAVEEFKRRYDHLHVLVNAAGAMYFKKQVTQEGMDRSLMVNYLDHFLLTHELLDMLKESRPARIITVAGNPRFLKDISHAKIDFEDIQLKKHYSGLRATSQALFARTYFTFELAKRLEGTGVTAVAFHPGYIKSNLAQNWPWYIKAMILFTTPFVGVGKAKEDCEIGVYLAASKEVENISGVFFDDQMKIMPYHEEYDKEAGRKLWSISEEFTQN